MIKSIDQILHLAQLTGDRLIVVDQQDAENSLAILSLTDYEELLTQAGLTRGKGFAKVNNDVASQETGDISVKSNFVEKIDGSKRSPWSIPASRQAPQDNSTDN
jgi:hypothetical protein